MRAASAGDTPAGRDIAPRLASRLGGAYLPSGTVLAEDGLSDAQLLALRRDPAALAANLELTFAAR